MVFGTRDAGLYAAGDPAETLRQLLRGTHAFVQGVQSRIHHAHAS